MEALIWILKKNNKCFSFKIGENSAWKLNYTADSHEENNCITTVYTFENGLKVTNVAKNMTVLVRMNG